MEPSADRQWRLSPHDMRLPILDLPFQGKLVYLSPVYVIPTTCTGRVNEDSFHPIQQVGIR